MGDVEVSCPRCGQAMHNLGNIKREVYLTSPPQWDDTYVCHPCRVRAEVRVQQRFAAEEEGVGSYTLVTPLRAVPTP